MPTHIDSLVLACVHLEALHGLTDPLFGALVVSQGLARQGAVVGLDLNEALALIVECLSNVYLTADNVSNR